MSDIDHAKGSKDKPEKRQTVL